MKVSRKLQVLTWALVLIVLIQEEQVDLVNLQLKLRLECNINRSGGLPKELSKSIYDGTRKMVNYT